MASKVIYFEHDASETALRLPFRSGEAGAVWADEEGVFETDTQVRISPNSLHALHGHGTISQLAELKSVMGQVGSGQDAVFAPGMVEQVLRIFYEADRKTYGARHDLLVQEARKSSDPEYRIVINNREYQRTLSRLQYLCSTSARMGQGVRLRV